MQKRVIKDGVVIKKNKVWCFRRGKYGHWLLTEYSECDKDSVDLYTGCMVYEYKGEIFEQTFDNWEIESIHEFYGNTIYDRVVKLDYCLSIGAGFKCQKGFDLGGDGE